MKFNKSLILPSFVVVSLIFFTFGCKGSGDIVSPDENNSAFQNELLKVVDSDETIQSFEPNYNEEDAMNFMGTTLGKEIYPLRIGQRMKLVERNLEIPNDSTLDEVTGTLYQKFEGVLIVYGYTVEETDSSNIVHNLRFEKPFTTEIYRKVKLAKVDSTGSPISKWRVTAVSLPQGGTLNPTAKIVSITLTPENGDPITIDDPNNYFFEKGNGSFSDIDHRRGRMAVVLGIRRAALLWLNHKERVTISVTVDSPNDSDFVSLTYGALKNYSTRVKSKFDLVSSSGNTKIYEKTMVTNTLNGNMHLVINVLNNDSVFDDSTAVEENTWGIPYLVK